MCIQEKKKKNWGGGGGGGVIFNFQASNTVETQYKEIW